MKIYRMSLGNNLKSSILINILLLTFFVINLYGYSYHPYYNLNVFLYTIVLFLPPFGSAVFIHVEYLIRNWNARLEVDRTNKKLKYHNDEKEISANFDKITKIVEHQVKGTALLFGFYKYYEIHLKNGETLIITNLMARDLSIPEVENEVIKRYLPSIFLDRYFGKQAA